MKKPIVLIEDDEKIATEVANGLREFFEVAVFPSLIVLARQSATLRPKAIVMTWELADEMLTPLAEAVGKLFPQSPVVRLHVGIMRVSFSMAAATIEEAIVRHVVGCRYKPLVEAVEAAKSTVNDLRRMTDSAVIKRPDK